VGRHGGGVARTGAARGRQRGTARWPLGPRRRGTARSWRAGAVAAGRRRADGATQTRMDRQRGRDLRWAERETGTGALPLRLARLHHRDVTRLMSTLHSPSI
jgi:hypothetical protein